MEATAQHYNETHMIGPRCPPEKSFWRWIIEDVRKGNNQIVIESFDKKETK